MLSHPLDYIYIPPKSSFEKGGLREATSSVTGHKQKRATLSDPSLICPRGLNSWMLSHQLDYIYIPPKSSFEKGGLREVTSSVTGHKQKKESP